MIRELGKQAQSCLLLQVTGFHKIVMRRELQDS